MCIYIYTSTILKDHAIYDMNTQNFNGCRGHALMVWRNLPAASAKAQARWCEGQFLPYFWLHFVLSGNTWFFYWWPKTRADSWQVSWAFCRHNPRTGRVAAVQSWHSTETLRIRFSATKGSCRTSPGSTEGRRWAVFYWVEAKNIWRLRMFFVLVGSKAIQSRDGRSLRSCR